MQADVNPFDPFKLPERQYIPSGKLGSPRVYVMLMVLGAFIAVLGVMFAAILGGGVGTLLYAVLWDQLRFVIGDSLAFIIPTGFGIMVTLFACSWFLATWTSTCQRLCGNRNITLGVVMGVLYALTSSGVLVSFIITDQSPAPSGVQGLFNIAFYLGIVLLPLSCILAAIGGGVAGAQTPYCESCETYPKNKKKWVWYGVGAEEFRATIANRTPSRLEAKRKQEIAFPYIVADRKDCQCGQITVLNLESHTATGGKDLCTPILTHVYIEEDLSGLQFLLRTGKVDRDF